MVVFLIALHFVGSAFKLSLRTIWPKYLCSRYLKIYFFALECKAVVCNYYSTQQRCCLRVTSDYEKTKISSK